MKRLNTEDLEGSENTLYDTIMVDTYHYAFVQAHGMYNTKNECKVNCGLWVILMGQYTFISCNKYTSLMWDVDNGEAVNEWGQGHMGNLCTFSILL